MWDIQLNLLELFFYPSFCLISFFFKTLNSLDPYLHNGLYLFNWKTFYQFAQNMTFFFGIKFLMAIAFLILIRGGTPRYRYDYLTKLGWLKFLGSIILVFLFSLLVFFIF